MPIRTTLLGIMALCLVRATPAFGDEAAEALCNRLLPAAALAADAGAGYVLGGLDESAPGEWLCTWRTGGSPARTLGIRYNAVGPSRAQPAYDEYVNKLKRPGMTVEPLQGLGLAATLIPFGPASFVVVRKAAAFFVVSGTGLTRDQAIAVARRLDALPPKTVEEARAALGAARRQPAVEGATAPAAHDAVDTSTGPGAACERLLDSAEITAALGPSYQLTHAGAPRPDFSLCEWRRAADSDAVQVRVHGRSEFTAAKVSTAAAYLEAEARMAYCETRHRDVIAGIGVRAILCGAGEPFSTLIVQRENDVLVVTCPACTREQIVALARAAVAPSRGR